MEYEGKFYASFQGKAIEIEFDRREQAVISAMIETQRKTKYLNEMDYFNEFSKTLKNNLLPWIEHIEIVATIDMGDDKSGSIKNKKGE